MVKAIGFVLGSVSVFIGTLIVLKQPQLPDEALVHRPVTPTTQAQLQTGSGQKAVNEALVRGITETLARTGQSAHKTHTHSADAAAQSPMPATTTRAASRQTSATDRGATGNPASQSGANAGALANEASLADAAWPRADDPAYADRPVVKQPHTVPVDAANRTLTASAENSAPATPDPGSVAEDSPVGMQSTTSSNAVRPNARNGVENSPVGMQSATDSNAVRPDARRVAGSPPVGVQSKTASNQVRPDAGSIAGRSPVEMQSTTAGDVVRPDARNVAGSAPVGMQSATASNAVGPAAAGTTPDQSGAPMQSEQEWFAVWEPFHSQYSAKAFAARLQRVTGLDYRVVKDDAGRHQVVMAYHDEKERVANLALIEETTGLQLAGSQL